MGKASLNWMARTPQTAQWSWLLWPGELVVFETWIDPAFKQGENTRRKDQVRRVTLWGMSTHGGSPTLLPLRGLVNYGSGAVVRDPGARELERSRPPALG